MTVIKKLNEFMHEKHPGVQDMAAETFLKISKLTKHMFTQKHDEKPPYVITLIESIPVNCKDLEEKQKLQVYEGIGCMVSTEQQQQVMYLQELLKYTNQDWQIIIQRANQGTNELMTPEIIKSIDFMIKVNQKVAQSVGQTYLAYLQQIFTDLIKIYKLYSECISNLVNHGNG